MKKFYKQMAEQHELSQDEVRKVCESEFKFLRSIIEKGDEEFVRLQYLGSFQVRESTKKRVKNGKH
jgi:nucleoid DNA-binding protein